MQAIRGDKWSYLPLLLVLPVIAVVVSVASSGPWKAEGRSLSPTEVHALKRTENLLAGIPQHGSALGDPKAPITLQFFGDLQCADSRRVMLGALPILIRHWVRDGKLRIIYRSTKSDTKDGPEFRGQQGAAMAAGRQGKMWTFIDIFYREQQPEFTNYADDAFLEGIAEQVGVEQRRWEEDRASEAWPRQIDSDEVLAWHKEVPGHSTPSFLIGPTGGVSRPVRHFSFEDPEVFNKAIRELL